MHGRGPPHVRGGIQAPDTWYIFFFGNCSMLVAALRGHTAKAMACPRARCLGHGSLVWTASLGHVGDSGCICVHLCFLIFTICM